VRLSPDNLVAYNLLGKALYTKKHYKKAIKILDRALRLEPGTDELRFNLAIAHLANRNRDAAIIHYNFLKNSNPPLAEELYKSIYADNVIFVD
jgi:tetratricopeptide (TPR) repeat protein